MDQQPCHKNTGPGLVRRLRYCHELRTCNRDARLFSSLERICFHLLRLLRLRPFLYRSKLMTLTWSPGASCGKCLTVCLPQCRRLALVDRLPQGMSVGLC